MPSMPTSDDLERLLKKLGLARLISHPELFAPAIRMKATLVTGDDEISLGSSKFGGRPDLPESFAWPEGPFGPIPFLAQVRCSEAAQFDAEGVLPQNGVLYFFFDTEGWLKRGEDLDRNPALDQDLHKVVHIGNDSGTLIGSAPSVHTEKRGLLPVRGFSFFPALTQAPVDSPEFEPVQLDADEKRRYDVDLRDALRYDFEQRADFQMLGFVDTCQGDVRRNALELMHCFDDRCQRKPDAPMKSEILKKGREWQILFFVDFFVGESTINTFFINQQLAFMIHRGDLDSRNFAHTFLVGQGT
jgi:hypothetical protein